MRTLKLAWRNIWRNRRRTLISMSAVSLGLALVLVFGSLITRMMSEAKNELDNVGVGHVEISAAGWRAHRSTKAVLTDSHATIEKLAGVIPPGSDVGARLLSRGLLSAAHGNAAVEVHGVDWDDEKKLSEYTRNVVSGALPAADDDKGILIGEKLAQKMELQPGNKVRLMVQRADGDMGVELYRVRGIFHALASNISEHRVLVSRAGLGVALGTPGAAHDIVIQLERATAADDVAAKARTALGADAEVVTYSQLYPMFQSLEAYTNSVTAFASIFVYFLVGLGILNTILMSVLERTREIGVLQALGTRPGGIVALILAESFWIATLSVVLGLAIGMAVCWYGSRDVALLDYSKQMGEGIEIGGTVMRSAFKTQVSLKDAIGPSLFVYVMAVCVGLYPAWRITRMRVVDALHAK